MPQFARPTADILVSSWTNQSGASVNLYQSIDEITPSDADYVQSEQMFSETIGFLGTLLIVQLGPLIDPGIDTGFVLRVRASKDIADGNETDLVVELRQGYLNDSDTGILIATLEIFNLTDVVTDYLLSLTEAQAALITDFSALSLRFVGRVGAF